MIIRPEEWISEPDAEGNGFLEAWVEDGDIEFPIPIETHNVQKSEVRMDQKQDFDFILECADKPEVYHDEVAFKDKCSLAPESVIPAGLFSVTDDKDFVKSPRIILNGRVSRTYDDPTRFGFAEADVLCSLMCLGNEYDVVIPEGYAEGITFRLGDIISGLFWVQGWPKEEL